MENLARDIIRASFSQERMTLHLVRGRLYTPEESKVHYRSKDGKKENEFDALEWPRQQALAAMPVRPKLQRRLMLPCPQHSNDTDPDRYEPHYTHITREDQVQGYEAIMVTSGGNVTTGLFEVIRFVKDKRLLPDGFDKQTDDQDIAVHGAAATDPDFKEGGDTVLYSVPVGEASGPFSVQVRLMYQPIGFRQALNLIEQEAEETARFVAYYRSMSQESHITLAADDKLLDTRGSSIKDQHLIAETAAGHCAPFGHLH